MQKGTEEHYEKKYSTTVSGKVAPQAEIWGLCRIRATCGPTSPEHYPPNNSGNRLEASGSHSDAREPVCRAVGRNPVDTGDRFSSPNRAAHQPGRDSVG